MRAGRESRGDVTVEAVRLLFGLGTTPNRVTQLRTRPMEGKQVLDDHTNLDTFWTAVTSSVGIMSTASPPSRNCGRVGEPNTDRGGTSYPCRNSIDVIPLAVAHN